MNRTTSRAPWLHYLATALLLLLTACGSGNDRPLSDGSDATATLSWTPPTQNTDDSPLTDLKGYWLYIGNSPDNLQRALDIPATDANGQPVTRHTLNSDDLFNLGNAPQAGETLYFALTAYNSLDIESRLSEIVFKTF